MADGYEVFDTGHDGWQPTRLPLNEAECQKVFDALRPLRDRRAAQFPRRTA